jgi:F-type H+-transporting ATPase subunit epsilon
VDVSIVTPEKEVWRGEADLVIARSPEGEFGIMRGHIPFLAALVPGLVTVVSGSQRDRYIVPGGFLEASGPADDYHVIVLADDAEDAGDIDAAEARRRIEDAQREAEEDVGERAEAGLRAAMAQPGLGRD